MAKVCGCCVDQAFVRHVLDQIVGKAASVAPSDNVVVSGVLIKKGFTHRIVTPEELPSLIFKIFRGIIMISVMQSTLT